MTTERRPIASVALIALGLLVENRSLTDFFHNN